MSPLQFSSAVHEDNAERVALILGCDPIRQVWYRNRAEPRIEVSIMKVNPGGGFRWADWSSNKANAFMVSGLYLRADMAGNKNQCDFTNLRAVFDVEGEVDTDTAHRMARTLHRAAGRLDVSLRSGSHVDMLIGIRDTLRTFGIERIFGYVNDTARGDLDSNSLVELPHMRAMMGHVKQIYCHVCNAPNAAD